MDKTQALGQEKWRARIPDLCDTYGHAKCPESKLVDELNPRCRCLCHSDYGDDLGRCVVVGHENCPATIKDFGEFAANVCDCQCHQSPA